MNIINMNVFPGGSLLLQVDFSASVQESGFCGIHWEWTPSGHEGSHLVVQRKP